MIALGLDVDDDEQEAPAAPAHTEAPADEASTISTMEEIN